MALPIINLFHMFFVAPLFLWLSQHGSQPLSQNTQTAFFVLAIGLFLFHASIAYKKSMM